MTDKIFVGRRKNSVARVYLRHGDGKVVVNDRELENYFPIKTCRDDVVLPLKMTETFGKYDIFINVNGGGFTGQSEAARLGISRALISINPEFKAILKTQSLLTRDPRMVERKKYGQKKARKRFQFSKR